MSAIPTIHDVEWSWSGWDEGEEIDPPEPGKRWLTINHWGEEYAVIVHRLLNDGRDVARMLEKQHQAERIVAALQEGSEA